MSAWLTVLGSLSSCSVCRNLARSCAGPGHPKTAKAQPWEGDRWDRAWQVPLSSQDSPTCLLHTGGVRPPRDKTLCPSRCSTAAPRRTGCSAFHAGKTLHEEQKDFKGQESRMELAKVQPGTVTLQKRHKGHDRGKKKKGKKGKKTKKEKYRNTHCSDRNTQFLIGEMSSCTAQGEKPGSPREGGSLPGQVRGTHRALAHACPDATPALPCLLLVQCLITSKKQIPDANNLACTARCTGSS